MTGNVVFLGLGIAGAGAISAWASLTALVLFLGGGVVGGRVASALADDRDRHLRVAIGIQTFLVAAALVVAREGPSSSGPLRLRDSHRSRRPLARTKEVHARPRESPELQESPATSLAGVVQDRLQFVR